MGIIASATDAIITVDENQKITVFNAAAERMFRCPAAEALGRSLERFIPQRYRAVHGEHIARFGETGGTARAMGEQRPITALRSDGVEFPVEATISQIMVGGQKLFTAIVRDISERLRSEEALRESEGRLRAIVETAVDGIITIDERGCITSFNPAATRLFGYTAEEVMGKNVNILMPAPYHGEHDGYLKNYRETGVKKIIGIGREVIGQRKDSAQFPMDLAVSETRLGTRRIFTGIVRDISERRQGERALAESQERLFGIISSATDAIITVDEQQKITLFNAAAERMFCCPADRAIGRHLEQFIPNRFRVVHGEHIRHFSETGVTARAMGAQRPLMALRSNGVEFPVEATISQITVAGVKLFTAIVRDISERKRAEEALARQAEELARSNVELERFAYVASHDLQEPMRTVRSFAQLLQRRAAEKLSGDAEEYLRFITDGVQRMQNLINDLLAYSRVSSQGAAFAAADCSEILSRVLENLKATIEGQHADVTFDPLPNSVVADATQLGQLFQNLLVNAIKFHGERPPRIHVSASEKDGEWVFAVKDNGIGIEPEYFERIFIIFQRLHTIEEYAGTGIGLAICKKIVERHGGRIWLESTVGQGSTFSFSIAKRVRGSDERHAAGNSDG